MSKPTIQDVADRAQVSKATVSAVLNHKDSVKDTTRERVQVAIQELNYRPSADARRRKGGARSVGFLLREIANPYYAEIIGGAEELLQERGYLMLVAASEGALKTEERVIDLFTQKGVDGLLLTPTLNREADLAHIFDLRRRNVPFVLLEAIQGMQASLVEVDNVAGAKAAVRHLIELGHTRIVHFAGPEYSLHSDERLNGVRAAYSESRLVFSPDLVVSAGDSLADGYRAGMEYFRSVDPCLRPTGVTCYNDLVALGLCRALAELGHHVPDDVSVVGYDDLQLLDYVAPRLTSVRVPKREVGRVAAEILLRDMEGRSHRTPQKVYLQADLVVRASTSAPAEARQGRLASAAMED